MNFSNISTQPRNTIFDTLVLHEWALLVVLAHWPAGDILCLMLSESRPIMLNFSPFEYHLIRIESRCDYSLIVPKMS